MAEIDQYALTNLENTKEYLQISEISKDNLLIGLINRSTGAIEKWCDRKFKSRTHTETHYLDTESQRLFVSQYPITEITSISDDGTALTVEELAKCENRTTFIKLDKIRSGKIVVVYKAGFSTIPYDLENACLELIFYYYKTDIANFSTVFAESGQVFKPSRMPPHVTVLLEGYRRMAI